MAKIKTTKKAILAAYPRVISIGYCGAQYLLKYATPYYYTSSDLYGWRADIYIIDGTAIATGYAPFGNIRPDYEIIKKWETKAEKAAETIRDYDDRRDVVNGYLKEFIKEVTQ